MHESTKVVEVGQTTVIGMKNQDKTSVWSTF